jgi:hypothetical protein
VPRIALQSHRQVMSGPAERNLEPMIFLTKRPPPRRQQALHSHMADSDDAHWSGCAGVGPSYTFDCNPRFFLLAAWGPPPVALNQPGSTSSMAVI